jgi:flagellar biosynthesis/type III secretory pathway M-ring protein FliF/YscJ
MLKFLSLILLFTSSFALAETPKTVSDVVQLQGSYNATIEQVQQSVVNMYVPDGGVAVIDITGQDRFLSYTKNTNQMNVEIKSAGKTVAIKSDVDNGYTQTISIETLCGRSVSVNIIGLSSKTTPDTIKPKLLISAPSC